MKLKTLNLRFLIQAHTKLGLFALFFFYISAFFGTVTLFLPQIKTWESPSRYFIKGEVHAKQLDSLIQRTIQEEGFSTDMIEVTLPSYRDDVIAINDPASRTKYVNPYTLKMLDTTKDRAFLSQFFNDIHVGRNIPKLGQLLMGISSILIIFLLLSGIMLFINKHKAKKSFSFKWHRDISLLLLPYIIVFALTGSVLGFMLGSSAPFAYAATEAKQGNMRALVGPIIFPRETIPKKGGSALMLNIDKLKKDAQSAYPELLIKKFILLSWYDKSAQIKFLGSLKNNRIVSGNINRQYITLSGVTGEVLEKSSLESSHVGKKFLSSFYFFHFIPDEELLVRIIYLILGMLFLISMGFGFLIWSQKKAKEYTHNPQYFSFLSRFSMAVLLGVIPATALTLLLFWSLPFDLFERVLWIKGAFYAFWALLLLLSVYFDDVMELIKTYCFITSTLLFMTILAHMIALKEKLAKLVQSGEFHTVLAFDLCLLILSVLAFLLYKYLDKIEWIRRLLRREYVS